MLSKDHKYRLIILYNTYTDLFWLSVNIFWGPAKFSFDPRTCGILTTISYLHHKSPKHPLSFLPIKQTSFPRANSYSYLLSASQEPRTAKHLSPSSRLSRQTSFVLIFTPISYLYHESPEHPSLLSQLRRQASLVWIPT